MAWPHKLLAAARDNALSSALSALAAMLLPWHDKLIEWLVRHISHTQAAAFMIYLTIAILLLTASVLFLRSRVAALEQHVQQAGQEHEQQLRQAGQEHEQQLRQAHQTHAHQLQQALLSRHSATDYQELQPAPGITVFTDKQPPAEGRMPRWYCARCLTIDGKLSILQANHSEASFDCHECGARLHLSPPR